MSLQGSDRGARMATNGELVYSESILEVSDSM